jgi:ATP-binding cassette, subfamily B, bacterial
MISQDSLSRLRRALRLVWESAPGWTLASTALLLIQGALPLVSLCLMRLIVNTVVAGLSKADRAATLRQFMLLVALSGGVALAAALCASLARLVNHAQAEAVTDHISGLLHAKSIQVDLEYYENAHYYDTLHRAQQEASYRPAQIVSGLVQTGQGLVSVLGIAGLLFSLHWAIGPVLVVAALPGAFARSTFARRLYRWEQKRTPAERQVWYYNRLLTEEPSAKEVRLFGFGRVFIQRFCDLRRQLRGERLHIDVGRAAAESTTALIEIGAAFGLCAFMGYQALYGLLSVGDLVMYFQAVQRAQGFLGQILSSSSELYESQLFLSSLFAFLELQPKVAGPRRPVPLPRRMRDGIAFEQVSFQYPGSARKVLDNVSLTIRAGEHVALVGENGAGKSTLAKLLGRLYDPTAGIITLDGIDLRQFDIDALRSQISIAFQDYVQYQLTAAENIWLGNVASPPDPIRIAAAAHQAGAHDAISRLTHGYETRLGKWFDGAEELSIGEWQKVVLARAFLRDAPIVILDEPTSAMDARAEYELFQRFHQLTEGRTAILISHRLSTVRMADRIYVLENGRIAESGSHDELVSRGERYATLFETQAQHYR